MKRLYILAASLACASAIAGGQAEVPKRGVPTMTRNVLTFTTLENDWADAVARHDTATLDKLVADRFELRSSAAPGVPTPRAESLRQSLALAPFKSAVTQMAVHEYPDLMVVSFLWTIDSTDTSLAKKVFVVDTWKRNGDGWQVAVRYASPVDVTTRVPGAAPAATQAIEKKY
ncbi:hypothetical protein GCM10027321_10670 [Massilia terrae]|uniref:Nuclear transport factor 2 family protein n=1 Tax=Massilia terrae TaxID=1811224 RepID=A0ABT2D229_9BURK|nr:nuclear transport factor 2 family protein [Massilia terrae]MCS0660300.1 nuclear transport factor 2 family protein [Massilia terrae]